MIFAIADLHFFVYGRAECAFISLECTKVKLLKLNNFELYYFFQRKMSGGPSGSGGSKGATVDSIWEHRDVRFDIPIS